MSDDWLVNLRQARDMLARSGGTERSAFLLRRGSMRIGLYSPRGVDQQNPHGQDEVYLVLAGRGTVLVGDETRIFEPGDIKFVAAGAEHRFADFSPDFEVCVIFWGPDGGETSTD